MGMTVNADVCRSYVMSSIGIVTYFNDVIGHEMGDTLGQRAAREGASIRDLAIDEGLLLEAEVDQILSPESLGNLTYRGGRLREHSTE